LIWGVLATAVFVAVMFGIELWYYVFGATWASWAAFAVLMLVVLPLLSGLVVGWLRKRRHTEVNP
jgi:hypothetical protein